MSHKRFLPLLTTLVLLALLAAGCTTGNETPEPDDVELEPTFDQEAVPPSSPEPTVPPAEVTETVAAGDEDPAEVTEEPADETPVGLPEDTPEAFDLPLTLVLTTENVAELEMLTTITLEAQSVTHADWSQDKSLAAAVTPVGVFLVDLTGGELPISLNPTNPTNGEAVGPTAETPPGRAMFVPSHAVLAVEPTTADGQVTLWNIANPYTPSTADLTELNELAEGAARVAFTQDGGLMATASAAAPGEIVVWNVATRDAQMELNINDDLADGVAETGGVPIEKLTFSPDGTRLAVWPGAGANILVYSVGPDAGELLEDYNAEGLFAAPVARPLIGAEWEQLAWISRGTVVLIDMETGEEIRRIEHEDFVEGAAFARDGRLLATSTAETVDGALQPVVKFWDTQSGEAVAALTGFNGVVQAIAFSDDDTLLATGSGTGSLVLWGVPEGD